MVRLHGLSQRIPFQIAVLICPGCSFRNLAPRVDPAGSESVPPAVQTILGAAPQVSGSGTSGAAGGLNPISRSMVRDDQSNVGEMHKMHALHLDAHAGTRPGSCGEA